jgi:hypothetical protein
MNAGPWTSLRRPACVPVPEEKQGVRATVATTSGPTVWRALQVANLGSLAYALTRPAFVSARVCRAAARRGCVCPDAAVRAMQARLLPSCLLLRSLWLTAGGQGGGARVLHRRGGRAVVAVSGGVSLAF